MQEETTTRAYELAYHLVPDMEESAVPMRVQDVQSVVTQNGGAVQVAHDAKRIHLSYPIANKHYAYFGVIDFNGGPETIDAIQAQLKLQEGVLRFLITAKPVLKEIRSLGDKIKRAKTHVAPTHHATAPEKPAEKASAADKEKIEKELENVLEKL